MTEEDANFKVTLSIKNESDAVPVFYKIDKNRFKKEKTVKLMVGINYRLDLSFKPPQTLTKVLVGGEETEVTEKVRDSTASAYSVYVPTSDTKPTSKGERDELSIKLQLKGDLNLQTNLQVKYYKKGDSQHCQWGSTFHCVEYDCETHADVSIVSVLKEIYR